MIKNYRRYYIIFLLMAAFYGGFAQNVGINTTGAAPNSNAGLDVNFPDKGILIPRIALVSATSYAPLSAHVAGMIVYNTATTADLTPGFYYNNGARWVSNLPAGTATGDMLYWNGAAWVRVPAGSPGQFLQFSPFNTPFWTGLSYATLSTTPASSILDIMATSGGNITDEGGSPVISRGVCWSTATSPTIADDKTVDGSGPGVFTSLLTGLTPSTTYYVRAYAINSATVCYGNQETFTTTTSTLPVLDPTTAATSITTTGAITGGNLTSTGNAAITQRGVCYSTSNPPTTANATVIDAGTGLGSFTSTLTGLTSNTVYYVRSFATNSAGTGYGDVTSFTTQAIVSTTAITGKTTTGATTGGTITPGGGAAITARGVCWSTSLNPVPGAGNYTSDATGTGSYTSIITGLSYTTLYHVRAYATNAGGTVYGSDLTFTTLTPTAPIVTSTTTPYSITGNSAISGGNITSDGGAPITERGVFYGTGSNPSILKVVDGTPGTGVFTSNIAGLSGGTLYYVRAYATNSIGTTYAAQKSFTTLLNLPVITTTPASSITAAGAVSGGSYTVNGLAGNYWDYGIAISETQGAGTPTYISTSSTPPNPWTTILTGLTGGTTYYIRAYIHGHWNGSESRVYGNELSFTTLGASTPVIASTAAASLITDRSANSGGTITSDGGSPITAKGVCWSTSPTPVLGIGNFTTATGGNTFTSSFSGLTASTIYYVRAYATNANGTSYGPVDVTFTTTHLSLYTLGQHVGYGWVIYVDPATGGGLIVSDDITSTAGWGCNGVNVAVSAGLGTGQANTNLILATDLVTRPIAASVANDYSVSYSGTTYSDWYLPSMGEWGKIAAIASTVGVMTGTNNYYTSSQHLNFYTYAGTYFTTGGNQLYTAGAQRIPGINDYVDRLRVIRDFAGTAAVAPTVLSTTAVTSITDIGGTSGGYISSDGGATVTMRGVCYGTSPYPDITGTKTTNGTGMGSFTSVITGLTTGLNYYVRAYATNSVGTSYGNDVTFVPNPTDYPVVTTDPVTALTSDGGTSGGNVTSNGGGTIIARGVCWSTSPAPVLETTNFTLDNPPDLGTFTSTISGLSLGTLYYVRAYATNGTGTAYGNEERFTTNSSPDLASVTTYPVTAIHGTSGTAGGNIVSEGGSPVTVRGVCWSITANPEVGVGNFTTDGAGTGSFTTDITGLTNGQVYHVRAYATNSTGMAYGNDVTFIPTGLAIPIVTTTAYSNLTGNTVTSGGNVTSTGGDPVLQYGVVYGPNPHPDINNGPYTVDGSGMGSFVSNLTGLITGQLYYLRAYAQNNIGTAYGNEISFTPTGAGFPTVITAANITNPTPTGGTSGGDITSNGGGPITAYGICWKPAIGDAPTILDSKTVDGTTDFLGVYTSTLTGLVAGNQYAIRAYATNSVGTSYGEMVFYTPVGPPTLGPGVLTYFAGNTDAQIGLNIINNGGFDITAYGAVWSTLPDPTVDVNEGITIETAPLMPPTAAFSGLSPLTTYYVRAYATNSNGPSYSPQAIFTTQDNTLPSLSTNPNIDKVGAIAYGGGEVFDIGTGGTEITNAGLVWGTSANPTVASNLGMTTDGASGSFTSVITGLTLGTTYHVRAYASNDNGGNYSYGADVYFVATAATVGQQINLSSGATYAVFSTDGTGLHGLIAQPLSYYQATDWGCSPSTVGTSTAVGTGEANTAAIIADITTVTVCESANGPGSFAAEMAASSFGPGWYLPSKEELGLMWTNRVAAQIDFSVGANAATFWSSSEETGTNAWYIDGTTGSFISAPKTEQIDFFTIRSF